MSDAPQWAIDHARAHSTDRSLSDIICQRTESDDPSVRRQPIRCLRVNCLNLNRPMSRFCARCGAELMPPLPNELIQSLFRVGWSLDDLWRAYEHWFKDEQHQTWESYMRWQLRRSFQLRS